MSIVVRALALAILVLAWLPAPAAAGGGHAWPIANAVVTRPFDPPEATWSRGHRGVDLRAAPRTTVRASGPGTVGFAGSVAGTVWVSVDHAGGLRTSYGPLADVEVAAGDVVVRGAPLGEVAASVGHLGLHWSARRAGEYLDPLTLLAGDLVPSLVGPGSWQPAGEHPVPTYAPWDGRDLRLGFLPGTSAASAPGWLAAPTPNHVIGVPGLATSSGSTPLPLDFLGYDEADMTILSHAGRTEAVGDPLDPWRDQAPQGPLDTLDGVHATAVALRDQLRAQWAREPGVAVDLAGHSMGGVVVLHYLLALHDPADPTLPPIANVVTLAAPLQGADLASAGQAVRDRWSVTSAVLALAAGLLDAPLRDGTLDDLAVGSPLLRDLAEAWGDAQRDPYASPLATGTRVLTIGGSTDVVVPEHRSDLPGAAHVVVPGGHTAMHRSEATLQVVRAFLEQDTVPAGSGSWGAWTSGAWSGIEQLIGVLPVP